MTIPGSQSFQLGSEISVSINNSGLKLFRDKNVLEELGYPEAALWDFASRHYRFDKICYLLKHVTQREDVEKFASTTLTLWVKQGYLKVKGLAFYSD